MKEIKAIVKPFKVDSILGKLLEAGYPNITVSLGEGTGSYTDDTDDEPANSTCFSFTNVEVVKIEIVCHDTDVEKVAGIISSQGRTGSPGDGIIYITDVVKSFRVKTGTELFF